ncbi:MAG: AraC family transcriptional regulator [Cyclobacteriaceae bacterium]|nr:AraC family transcriptional regulator [Cyclobacteriaceae bacterium]
MWQTDGVPFAVVTYTRHEFPRHFHDHHVIMRVDAGINLGEKNRRPYAVMKNQLLFINPGEVHNGRSAGGKPLTYQAIYPDDRKLKGWLEAFELESNAPGEFTQHIVTEPEIANTFSALFHSDTRRDPLAASTLTCQLLDLLKVHRRPASLKPENDRIRKAKAYLIDHSDASEVSLTELSRHVGLSPYYFIRLFKQTTGLTPFEYARNHRVEHAKRLMRRHPPMSLTEIAVAAGFYDQSHFIRAFRKVTGTTPLHHRRTA